mmetsp:Transcript_21045/g.48731  ORF Transcript_21045/g.48731 Transcript_21045/m.48731 type:complete len:202 (+) Transcript_21045:294-899(+)
MSAFSRAAAGTRIPWPTRAASRQSSGLPASSTCLVMRGRSAAGLGSHGGCAKTRAAAGRGSLQISTIQSHGATSRRRWCTNPSASWSPTRASTTAATPVCTRRGARREGAAGWSTQSKAGRSATCQRKRTYAPSTWRHAKTAGERATGRIAQLAAAALPASPTPTTGATSRPSMESTMATEAQEEEEEEGGRRTAPRSCSR